MLPDDLKAWHAPSERLRNALDIVGFILVVIAGIVGTVALLALEVAP
jgi:hypothetical protein